MKALTLRPWAAARRRTCLPRFSSSDIAVLMMQNIIGNHRCIRPEAFNRIADRCRCPGGESCRQRTLDHLRKEGYFAFPSLILRPLSDTPSGSCHKPVRSRIEPFGRGFVRLRGHPAVHGEPASKRVSPRDPRFPAGCGAGFRLSGRRERVSRARNRRCGAKVSDGPFRRPNDGRGGGDVDGVRAMALRPKTPCDAE